MADPMTSLFGKRAFRGTGRTEDYFPEAPDLAFLDRPTFIAPGAGYNPKLDPQSLVSAGFSPRNAMVLQDMRRQFHEQARMEREQMDATLAMDSLSRLDPSSKGFSKELLNIFRQSPNAIHNPEVRQTAEFISRFANQKPEWSIENIEDPDIYQQAVNEKWDVLTPAEARRRANSALTQRSIRGELAALGMTKEDLDKNKAWSQEDYLREKGRLLRESKAAPREALGSSELAKFNEALTEYNSAQSAFKSKKQEDADTQKKDLFKAAKGRDPVSAQDWQEAYAMAEEADVGAARSSLRQLVDLYQGRNIPPVVLQALGVPTTPSVSDVTPLTTGSAVQWPIDAPTTVGPQATPLTVPPAASQAPNGATVLPTPKTPPSVQTNPYRSPSGEVKSIGESKQDTMSPEQQQEAQSQVQDFYNYQWTGAKDQLTDALQKRKGLERLADDPNLLLSLFRSIEKKEAVLPQDIGLPKTEGVGGSARPENPVNLIAQVLGKDPAAEATVTLPSGRKTVLTDKDGKRTWGEVIQAWAADGLKQAQGAVPKTVPPLKTASGNQITIGQLRRVP